MLFLYFTYNTLRVIMSTEKHEKITRKRTLYVHLMLRLDTSVKTADVKSTAVTLTHARKGSSRIRKKPMTALIYIYGSIS